MRIPLLFVILAISSPAAELRLDSAPVSAAAPATLSLRLQSDGSELTGVQFDIEYDASRFDVKLEIGPAGEDAVKVLQSNTLQPGKQRVLVFGFNRTKMNDGVVALAHVSLKAEAATGDAVSSQAWPIQISETAGTSAEGKAVQLKGAAGSVTTGRGTKSPARSNAR